MDSTQVVAALLAALAAMGGTVGLVIKQLLARDERMADREEKRTDRVMTTLETTIAGNHAAMQAHRDVLEKVTAGLTELTVLVREGRTLDRQEHQAIIDATILSNEKFTIVVEEFKRSVLDAIGKATRREP